MADLEGERFLMSEVHLYEGECHENFWPDHLESSGKSIRGYVQGYLAHKKAPNPLETP